MTDLREEIANQFAGKDLLAKVRKYCDLIKTDQTFKYLPQDTQLVHTLLEFHTYTADESYAEGYNEGRFVRKAKEKAHGTK